MSERYGAVDLNACPTRTPKGRCQCDKCARCGFGMHTAIHGPVFGAPAGSAPYGHRFVPSAPRGTDSTHQEE